MAKKVSFDLNRIVKSPTMPDKIETVERFTAFNTDRNPLIWDGVGFASLIVEAHTIDEQNEFGTAFELFFDAFGNVEQFDNETLMSAVRMLTPYHCIREFDKRNTDEGFDVDRTYTADGYTVEVTREYKRKNHTCGFDVTVTDDTGNSFDYSFATNRAGRLSIRHYGIRALWGLIEKAVAETALNEAAQLKTKTNRTHTVRYQFTPTGAGEAVYTTK